MTMSGSCEADAGPGSRSGRALGEGYDPDCARIEAALAESDRGRHFLAAYADRRRGADTRGLLQAIARLEAAVGPEGARATQAVTQALATARADIAALLDVPPPAGLDAAARAAEAATRDIRAAAESIQDAAWTMRETGADAGLCDRLDRHAAAIGAACAALDRADRAARVIARAFDDLARMTAAHADGSGRPGEKGTEPSL